MIGSIRKVVFRDIVVYFTLALLICLVSVIFISVYSYHNLKQLANQESQSSLKASFSYELENLGYINSVTSVWTQAYENIVLQDNKEWLDNNIGDDVSKTFGIDFSIILNEKGDILHAYSKGGETVNRDKHEAIRSPLVDLFARNRSAKFNLGVVKDVITMDGKAYILAMGEVQPSYDKATRVDTGEKSRYLVLAKEINRALLSSLKKFSLIEELHFTPTADPREKPEELDTTWDVQNDHAYVGYFTWQATDRGIKIFTQILPVSIAVLLALSALAGLVAYNIYRAASGYENLIFNLQTTTKDLQEAKTVAERSSHEKSKFLATMSHEIRTPMNGIVGMISLLKETTLSQKQVAYVNTIENSSNSLMRLIDDVLEFSQSESKELKPVLGPVKIRDLVAEIQGLLQPVAIQRNLQFEIFFSQDVPLYVETDPVRFRQILLHLTSNAFKFTRVGHVKINVNIAPLDKDHDELIVQVVDTGVGISKAIQETLFTDFFSTAALNEGGTKEGLGLGIARNLVLLLGGKIDCESQLGQGSVFWFSLPVRRLQDDKKPAS